MIAFRILGPLEVEADGLVVKLGGVQPRTLLALLLLHANEVVPRDRLIEELWDGQAPETAATAIQVHVSQLRKVLGMAEPLVEGDEQRVVVDLADVHAAGSRRS